MFQCLNLFVLVSLSVAVESLTGDISKPYNLSVLWINDFEQQLSWAPPQNLPNCTLNYAVTASPKDETERQTSMVKDNQKRYHLVMNGGFLHFSVQADCGDGRKSEWADHNITYQELVRNVNCSIRSSSKTNCSWQLASHAPDFSFFYQLRDESGGNEDTQLQECPSYTYTDGNRTGCDLQMKPIHAIMMVFNGTLNNKLVRNTFRIGDVTVRPPPLNWTVVEVGDAFNISWIPPDVIKLDDWSFIINYTECDENKSVTIKGQTSHQLPRVAHCQYHMAIKAVYEKYGTEWSDKKYFGADPDAVVYVVFILIPLMFAGLAVLAFVCCRRNKESIFPKVPEPRDLLSDISDNNNKITVRNLYVPAKEEEDCKITLVIDPQLSKSHS
ncbi:uncharacterized protein LOC122973535 isoform X2 [Thunnus albacares]|uniref:uncharacterized protein LOC122973535 isoform X2 n=1 Tax=Thunnus albacares TaxID=8236 RepID=UPI001CF67437|nr:uncharacterized protein LOC122973535 isoform X2 [Thunnus albacares]